MVVIISTTTSRIRWYESFLLLVLIASYIIDVVGDCDMFNDCNGHGRCITSTSTCACYEGWGASTDITFYRSPDCSARSCPAGYAWADLPSADASAHRLAECSNRGKCNRLSGECQCFPGFTGLIISLHVIILTNHYYKGGACDKNACPNDCSGHGQCVSIKNMARMSEALPLGPNTYYEGDVNGATWDEDQSYGCVCDSSWPVGLARGERQQAEWFGPDCSLRHCPSADDPRTPSIDETNCYGISPQGSKSRGADGNICHVDCANRGSIKIFNYIIYHHYHHFHYH